MNPRLSSRCILPLLLAAAFFAMAACARRDPVAAGEGKAAATALPAKPVPAPSPLLETQSVKTTPIKDSPTTPSPTEELFARLNAVLNEPKREERQQNLSDLAVALARYHPVRAAEVAKLILAKKGQTDGDAHAFVSSFSSAYAAIDPPAMAAWAEFLPESLKFGALTFAAQQWASVDWRAATNWAERLNEPSLQSAMLRRIGEELERIGEPLTNAAWARRLAESPNAGQHTVAIARLWARADAQGAFQWSARIADPVRQAEAVIAIAAAVAEQNVIGAVKWVETFPPADTRSQAAAVTAAKWAESDPEAAANWLVSLGDGRVLEVGIHGVARGWLEKDRARATDWIRGAPLPQQTKDYLIPRE